MSGPVTQRSMDGLDLLRGMIMSAHIPYSEVIERPEITHARELARQRAMMIRNPPMTTKEFYSNIKVVEDE
jgi:hypothetical protein